MQLITPERLTDTGEVEEANTADDAIKFLPQTGSRDMSFSPSFVFGFGAGFGVVLGGTGDEARQFEVVLGS